jgi:hypothetical protein
MSVPGYAHGIQTSFLATMNARAHAARLAQAKTGMQTVAITPAATTAQASNQETFFDDVLDIVNPLQHIPVVSTLYRAATGDKIGDLERVAGDTLYGGLTGLGSSLANLAFKHITGKDFGDMVLSWLDIGGSNDNAPTAVASAHATTTDDKTAAAVQPSPTKIAAATAARPAPAPASPKPAATPTQTSMLGNPKAFLASLKARNVDPALGMRALLAYQKSLGLTGQRASIAAQP